ncbi:hypothetical protein [Candidatus Palauibacter sp.]|uniref:hypothetical protein n=1 Tax=Candidatus Palauibacter sp. TaxID=3101350 RepID=UPI003B01268C
MVRSVRRRRAEGGFATRELERGSADVGGDPGRGAQQAQPDSARLHGAPAAAEAVRAQDVKKLVGERGEVPRKGVAAVRPTESRPNSQIRCSTTAPAL